LVGDDLVAYLEREKKRNETPGLRMNLRRLMAEESLALFSIDDDGKHIVDYLGSSYKQMIAPKVPDEEIKDAWSFARRELARYQQQRDEELIPKYEYMVSYFRSRAQVWPDLIVENA
jgi:hypothetical protein